MQIRFPGAAFAAALLVSPLAHAEVEAALPRASAPAADICASAPREQFRPESQVRNVVETFLRYQVTRVGVDRGCYAVLASDRNGTPFEVRFRGSDLKMVSRYVVKDAPLDARSPNP